MSAELAAIALLNERFLLDYPREAARVLEGLSPDATLAALQARSDTAQLRAWQALAPDRAADVLEALPAERAGQLLSAADPQVGAAALTHVKPARRDALLAALPEGVAADLRALLQYPSGTAGQLMDPHCGAIGASLTIAEGIERLRGIRQRGLRELFAVDEQMQLVGQIEVEDLVLASRERTIREITRKLPAVVRDTDKLADVVETLQRNPQSVLPVVNESGRFLGVIRQSQLTATARVGGGWSRWFGR
jgi:magnesium transporter